MGGDAGARTAERVHAAVISLVRSIRSTMMHAAALFLPIRPDASGADPRASLLASMLNGSASLGSSTLQAACGVWASRCAVHSKARLGSAGMAGCMPDRIE